MQLISNQRAVALYFNAASTRGFGAIFKSGPNLTGKTKLLTFHKGPQLPFFFLLRVSDKEKSDSF